MGCYSSSDEKTVQCSRCKNSGNGNELLLTDNICQECLQTEYRRRLAVLRSLHNESVTASETASGTEALVTPIPTVSGIQSLPNQIDSPDDALVCSESIGKKKKNYYHRPVHSNPIFSEFKCPNCSSHCSSPRSFRGVYLKCQECGKYIEYSFSQSRKSDIISNTE